MYKEEKTLKRYTRSFTAELMGYRQSFVLVLYEYKLINKYNG